MRLKTKDLLIKVSRELIKSEGIDAISMRTLGKHAELSRSALYRHFENKASLLAAIVTENFVALGNTLGELENTIKDPKDLICKGLQIYHSLALENPDYYQLMFNTKWDEKKYPEIKAASLGVFQKFSAYVSRASSTKPLPNKICVRKTAILYAFIHGLVELSIAGHNEQEKGLHDEGMLIAHIVDSILS